MIAVPWSFVLPGNPALSQLLLSVSIALHLLSVSSFDPNRDRMIFLPWTALTLTLRIEAV